MLITQAQLINVSGLHARPASDFVKLAKSFQSKIIVRSADAPDEDAVNAKSIAAEDDEAGGVVAVGVDAGDEDFQPVEGGCLGAGCVGRLRLW